MTDIVSEARSMKPSTTWNRARVNEMADEIERLRDTRNAYMEWLFDATDRAERAEEVIEAADEFYTRFRVLHTTGQIEIPAEFHKYVEDLGVALEAYDEERETE